MKGLVFVTLLLALPAAAETVRLKTTDGVRLAADWQSPKKPKAAIVALHMEESDRRAWKPLVGPALERGIAVLALDLRGHGQSRRPKDATTGEALAAGMHQDVEAALQWLQRKHRLGPDRIVLFGAGVGATAALQAGAKHGKIAGAVLLTPITKTLGLDATEPIKRWSGRPLLLVASTEDAEEGASPLYDAAPTPKEAVLLKLPQKDIRGTAMFGQVKKIAERLVEWAALRVSPRSRPSAK